MLGYPAGMANFISSRFFLFTLLINLCVMSLLPAPAQAWGPLGHRLVAKLAADELTRDARKEVDRVLHGEPDPSLAGVASWADDLRENDPDLGKRSSRWHYVNLAEDNCAYLPAKQCPNGDCVIEAIHRQQAVLADRSQPDALRVQALKFLVHFVGDVHQPLHAGYARDRGGNTVQLQVNGEGSNLHRVWDSTLLDSSQRSERHYLRALRKLRISADIVSADIGHGTSTVEDWASASCRAVLQTGFYPAKAQLDPAYYTQWRPVAEQRLRLAGHHLAQLLNAALQNTSSSP